MLFRSTKVQNAVGVHCFADDMYYGDRDNAYQSFSSTDSYASFKQGDYDEEWGSTAWSLGGIIGRGFPQIVPFARYEYFDPQAAGQPGQTMDRRLQVSRWSFGLNWFALPNLVVKADYATRQIGTQKPFGHGRFTSENEFAIGVAYATWFCKK